MPLSGTCSMTLGSRRQRGILLTMPPFARRKIALSSISLAELVYLVEKNRLPTSAYEDLKNALADPRYVFEEVTFNGDVVEAMRGISRADVPDMPDRIVAATAVYCGVPVISRDWRIRASNVQTIW